MCNKATCFEFQSSIAFSCNPTKTGSDENAGAAVRRSHKANADDDGDDGLPNLRRPTLSYRPLGGLSSASSSSPEASHPANVQGSGGSPSTTNNAPEEIRDSGGGGAV